MNAIPATATARESAAPGAGAPQRLLQRLILPHESSPDIVPLYIGAADARSAATRSAPGLRGSTEHTPRAATDSPSTHRSAQAQADISELDERHSVDVPAPTMRSSGTYFTAFPASYWRRWKPVRAVRLTVRTSGTGHLVVMRSTARGSLQRQESRNISGTGEQVFDLPLTAFG